jgi:pimeloyl-ACP methyl ester carboxylesterase
MARQKERNVADFIAPLYMNGLQGRLLRLPPPRNKKREILFIYGHHSSLERWWGVVQVLNRYGGVTMPDLPGFGGMESFYKIGEKPDMDTMADYLAAFVKMRYKRRRVTIVGLSYGFTVATRMLQRYPDLVKKVDLLVSVVGFAHHEDFVFTRTRMFWYRLGTKTFSHRLTAGFFRHVLLQPFVLRAAYARTYGAKQKFEDMEGDEFNETMDFEIYLWHANDLRTHMKTCAEFLNLDNCRKQVDVPVWHIAVKNDRYFDHDLVEQHMRVIFTDFQEFEAQMDSHAPSVIADAKTAAPLFPPKLRRILSRD